MSGMFEYMAANDDSHRVAARKAVATARARAKTRYSNFLDAAATQEERENRLALVAGDLSETVKQACADMGHDDWEHVLASVQQHLGMHVESRRPKLCPVHREITDISLQQRDPSAGYTAMSQHMFGEQSCRGSWEGGRCNFKPEMTTQSYWDEKAEQAEYRRLEREKQQQEMSQGIDESLQHEIPMDVVDTEIVDSPSEMDDSGNDWGSDSMDTDVQSAPEMAMAARTAAVVPSPLVHGGSLGPLRMIEGRKPGIMVNGAPLEQFAQDAEQQMATTGMPQYDQVEVTHPHPTWEGIASDILRVGHDGPLKAHFDRVKAQRAQQQGGDPGMGQPPIQPQARVGEALKTIDIGEAVGPSPKMDKGEFDPYKKREIETEMEGSPHPTRHQDIKEPTTWGNDRTDNRFEQTDATLEHQDIDKNTNPSEAAHKQQGGSFGRGKQADPVTSAVDVDKNPIRESLADSFVPEDELAQAIATFKGE